MGTTMPWGQRNPSHTVRSRDRCGESGGGLDAVGSAAVVPARVTSVEVLVCRGGAVPRTDVHDSTTSSPWSQRLCAHTRRGSMAWCQCERAHPNRARPKPSPHTSQQLPDMKHTRNLTHEGRDCSAARDTREGVWGSLEWEGLCMGGDEDEGNVTAHKSCSPGTALFHSPLNTSLFFLFFYLFLFIHSTLCQISNIIA